MTIEIVVLILQILILLAILALKSYATEKGKNQATKEDIGEITREVECAKIDFSAQIEKLKAELNADIQRQLSLFVKRNEALTQFFEDSFTALTMLRSGKRYEDVEKLDRLIEEAQDRIVRAVTSYHRLTLYVQEESILNPALRARTALAGSLNTWWRSVNKFRDAFADKLKMELELAKKPDSKSIPNQSNNDTPARQAFKELQQATDSIVEILDDSLKEYCDALNTHFHSVDNSKALAAAKTDSAVVK